MLCWLRTDSCHEGLEKPPPCCFWAAPIQPPCIPGLYLGRALPPGCPLFLSLPRPWDILGNTISACPLSPQWRLWVCVVVLRFEWWLYHPRTCLDCLINGPITLKDTNLKLTLEFQ